MNPKNIERMKTIYVISLLVVFILPLILAIVFGSRMVVQRIIETPHDDPEEVHTQELAQFTKLVADSVTVALVLFYVAAIYALYRFILKPLVVLRREIELEDYSVNVSELTTIPEIKRLRGAIFSLRSEVDARQLELEREMEKERERSEELISGAQEQRAELERSRQAMVNILSDLNGEKVALEQANAKSRAILRSIAEGVVVLGIHNDVLVFNETAERITGLAAEKVLGEQWPDVLGEDTLRDSKGRVLSKEELPFSQISEESSDVARSAHLKLVRGDDARDVSFIVSRVRIEGELVGTVVVLRDITTEKQIERSKDEFVSLSSHQLQTPLASISWFAELLRTDTEANYTEKQKELISDIEQSARRMVELVDTLLQVARLELGTFIVEPTPTDVGSFLRDIIDGVGPLIAEKRVVVQQTIAPSLPTIPLDTKLSRIVFENLLSNAIKYTPAGGVIQVEGSMVSVDAVKPHLGNVTDVSSLDGEYLLFSVRDSGVGIPKEDQKRIFTKMYRASNVQREGIGGTGLGLYLVREIVEFVGGAIWFESVEKEGSIFTVALPKRGMLVVKRQPADEE